jgi:hypothetical protein
VNSVIQATFVQIASSSLPSIFGAVAALTTVARATAGAAAGGAACPNAAHGKNAVVTIEMSGRAQRMSWDP